MRFTPVVNPMTLTTGLAQSLLDWPGYEVVIIGDDGLAFQIDGYSYSSVDRLIVLSSPDNPMELMNKLELARACLATKAQEP